MTTRNRLPAPRGLTLLELVIALGVSTIVIAAASTLLIAQQRAHVAGSGSRALQETARVALADIGARLREAGYGLDPAMVLDFGSQDNAPRKSLFTAGKGYVKTYACNGAASMCRDRVDAPDEIVFHARDPLFSRKVSAVDAGSVTLRGELREPLFRGQILQVLCLIDQRTVAYVTVAQHVPASAAPDPNADVRVNLQAGEVGPGLGLPAFPFENSELASPCFAAGVTAVVAAKIDRFRYYVETFAENGAVVAHQTAGSRPYLMLDQGLTDQDGNPIRSPVAPDVEDLQLAYLYPPAAAGGGARVLGLTVGTDLAAEGVTVNVPPPGIGDAPDAPSRRTGNPTNILGVRIAVVVRTPEPDLARDTAFDRTLRAAGNRGPIIGLPMYRRQLFETTVMLKNIQGRGVVYPVVDPTRAIANSLVGGG